MSVSTRVDRQPAGEQIGPGEDDRPDRQAVKSRPAGDRNMVQRQRRRAAEKPAA